MRKNKSKLNEDTSYSGRKQARMKGSVVESEWNDDKQTTGPNGERFPLPWENKRSNDDECLTLFSLSGHGLPGGNGAPPQFHRCLPV